MDTYYHVSVRSAVIAIAKLKLTTPRSITLLMAHENIEVNLPLAKVYMN